MIPEIPPQTRAYILECVDNGAAPDRTRIACETGLGCEFVLSIICRVISEKHGFPGGPPRKEHVPKPSLERKAPKERTNLKPCSCGKLPHLGNCPVSIRERSRRYRAKAAPK